MRISQSNVQLAAQAEQFNSHETITQISHPETFPRVRPGRFANILANLTRPAPIPNNTELTPLQSWETISSDQQEMMQRFTFTPPPATPGSQQSLFGIINNYAAPWQTNLQVGFQDLPAPPLSFPSLDDLRLMVQQQRNFPTIRYDIFQIDLSHEAFNFTGVGQVATEDGRTIEFDFTLNHETQVSQVSHVSYTEEIVPMIDPLILDLDGEGVDMNKEFMFDLDSDGIIDRISQPGKGAGLLAYDRNKDGKINNGSELFGASSGNGFNELREYDLDGNDWIDENDAIYGDLSVWAINSKGNMVMQNLQEQEVGAIFLGSVRTPMSILNANGDMAGQMQESGVFLTESGEARTIHQMDLASRRA